MTAPVIHIPPVKEDWGGKQPPLTPPLQGEKNTRYNLVSTSVREKYQIQIRSIQTRNTFFGISPSHLLELNLLIN